MLEIESLSVHFKDNAVLNKINLQIKAGQVIGLLGRNGAGKTTLFETLYGNHLFNGSITFNDLKLKRKDIAYLETESYFYPFITGEEYLGYFNNDQNQISELQETFQLPLKKYAHQYSTGMKKKLALMGTLLLDKPLMILDEPFNGLDYEAVHLLYSIIEQLKTQQKTIIISSHIIETLFRTCDYIAILEHGEINRIYKQTDFLQLQEFAFQ